MTGDGAVVREWKFYGRMRVMALEGQFGWLELAPEELVDEHNAAIRQQAAEIERLTVRCKTLENTVTVHAGAFKNEKARNVDLLKALEECRPFFEATGSVSFIARVNMAIAAAKGGTV